MKTNLDKSWKTDAKVEVQGIAYAIGEDTFIVLKRLGGANKKSVEAAFAKHHKPYAGAISRGTFSNEKENEVMTRILVDSCVIGWKGITNEEGDEIEFSKENAFEVIKGLPELRVELMGFASDASNFVEGGDFETVELTVEEKTDLGNS